MRRPGIWVANGTPTDPVKMFSWRPGALTTFYDYLSPNRVPDYKKQHPEIPVIVRFQHPRNWHQDPTASARHLGEMVASKWPDLKDMDPYVYFANEVNLHYENGDNNVSNQPLYESREFYKRYANWVKMTADRIKQRAPRMKLVCPPFAFGHHEDGAPDDNGNPTEGWAGYDYLADTIRSHFANIITFHAYWGHAGGSVHDWLYDPTLSSWYAFRWRRVLNLFQRRYGIRARVLIDEAGNMRASDPDFTDQIMYHARHCLGDERVIAVTYFLWQDPTNHPGNVMNSWVQSCANPDDHVARLVAMPDVPIQPIQPRPEAPTIRVLLDDGTVKVLSVEEYLRGVVPAEVSARWPAEALKAQAVAARTYAMAAINHPRHHPDADICAATHCQVYNPARINDRTDQAVKMTEGQVIMYQGKLATAYYSANCGGHTVGNEIGFVRPGSKPPPPLPYLRPVPCINSGPKKGHGVGMCQWGAHDMAARGDSYVAILEHYYTGITISSEPEADTGLIQGAVTDQARQPMADVLLRLTREGWSEEVTSGSDGEYRFTQLPPAIYNLRAIDHDVERVGLPLSAGQKMTVDLNIPVAEGEWTMQLERKPGLPLLVGSMSRTGIEVTLQTPMDTTFEASSGSKPEYGMGGFEFWAPLRGTYQIQFLDQTFEIPMNGQFTHAAFTETSDEPTGNGVIHGVLRDQDGAVQAGRQITLTGPDLSRTVATDGNGSYRFGQLPASTYVLRVAGTPLSRQVHSTGRSPVTVDLELLPASAGQWLMKVTRMSGSPMIAGNLPEADIPVTVTSPSGPITRVVSGSKPEHGIGGFEVGAPQRGSYTIQFLDQTFNLPVDGRFTRIILIRGTHPIESQANIVSQTMPMSQAHDWLQYFESDPKTRGVFQVDES